MICKGWEKIGLLRRFNMHFLFQAMEVNIITTIFLITFNLKLGHKKKENKMTLIDQKILLLKLCIIVWMFRFSKPLVSELVNKKIET